MLSSAIPTKFPAAFANSAGAGFIRTIPTASQIGITPGAASLTDGFPPLNFDPIASGGIPPWGADMNGLMNQVTAWLQWVAAGGAPVAYDATFSTAISGYPQGALLKSATAGHYWISTTENNATDPDTGGAGWQAFPDALIQIQGGNFTATDSGITNAFKIALWPVPVSVASIVGSPIRFLSAHANTITTPTLTINTVSGSVTTTMINSNGAALLVNQISRSGQIVEGYHDGTYFQVTSPGPIPGAGTSTIPGEIRLWGAETPPTGFLECNGALYNIITYPNLFNAISNRFGGDGVNTFNVPDLRGEFVRGWDHGRGLDPNASTRTNSGNGTTGDHVGTNEAQSLKLSDVSGPLKLDRPQATAPTDNSGISPTTYSFYYVDGGTGVNNDTHDIKFASAGTDLGLIGDRYITGNASFSGGNPETRPVNINLMYIIAY